MTLGPDSVRRAALAQGGWSAVDVDSTSSRPMLRFVPMLAFVLDRVISLDITQPLWPPDAEVRMTGHDVAAGSQALARARDEDNLMWTSPRDSDRHRRARNHALAEAHEAGISLEQMADELGVLIKDVERMLATADTEPAQPSAELS